MAKRFACYEPDRFYVQSVQVLEEGVALFGVPLRADQNFWQWWWSSGGQSGFDGFGVQVVNQVESSMSLSVKSFEGVSVRIIYNRN